MRPVLYSTAGKTILSVLLALAILIFLFVQISLQDILKLLTNVSYAWIAVGVIFYFITTIGRAIRLQVLLPGQNTRLSCLLPITITQSMLNNILPSRLGELSLLYFLKKYQGVSLDRSGIALVIARIFDYIAVAMMFIIATLLIFNDLPQSSGAIKIIWGSAGLMLLSVLGIISLAWWGQSLVNLMHDLLERIGLGSQVVVKKGLNLLQRLITAFQAVHSLQRYLSVLGWSLIIWAATFTWFYAFMHGIGIQVPLVNTIVGSTFAVLSKAIPFISVGGLGAHEAGWTIGFMLVGLDKTLAISSGFAVNILTLLTSIVFGVGSLWVLRWQEGSDILLN